MFEDPAVMRMVQGRPSLKVIQTGLLWDGWDLVAKAVLNVDLLNPPFKGLDSAIVDCGKAMFWNSYEEDVSAHLAGCFSTNILCAATVEVFLSCSSWSHYLGRPEESRDRYFRLRGQGAH